MATGTDAILVGAPITATGGLSFAVGGDAVLPTDATTALDALFRKGGYIGEDGVTRTTDASDDNITAWGGDVVKVVRTDHSISYTFTFLESANADVLKLIHGEDNVIITAPTPTSGGKIEIRHTKALPPRGSFVFDMKDDPASIREVIGNGQLTSTGDAVFVHSDVIRYEATIVTFPDENGVKAYTFIDDGKFSEV